MFERYTAEGFRNDCRECGLAITKGAEAVAVGEGWRAETWHRACHERAVAVALTEMRACAESLRKLGVPCEMSGGVEITPVAAAVGAP